METKQNITLVPSGGNRKRLTSSQGHPTHPSATLSELQACVPIPSLPAGSQGSAGAGEEVHGDSCGPLGTHLFNDLLLNHVRDFQAFSASRKFHIGVTSR